MYYWVIILFSLVTIMTYKISGTGDEFEEKIAPAMEATAAMIVQQHNAALKYIQNNPDYTYSRTNGSIPSADLSKYGAYGVDYSNTGYKTVIICNSLADYNIVNTSCDQSGMNFLITYGDLPQKWQDDYIEAYFMTILGRYSQRTNQLGIIESTTASTSGPVLGSTYVVNSIQGKQVYLPRIFECVDNTISNPTGKLMYVTQLNHTEDGLSIANTATEDDCTIPF